MDPHMLFLLIEAAKYIIFKHLFALYIPRTDVSLQSALLATTCALSTI